MITLHDVPVIAGLAATTAALGWAAVSDVRHYLIPNRIPLIIAAAFGVAAIGTPPGSWLGRICPG